MTYDGDWAAVPGVAPAREDDEADSFLLDVDGERFRLGHDGSGTYYAWLSGPNDGYGFSTSAPLTADVSEHRDLIRTFLAQVDPATGYIEDD